MQEWLPKACQEWSRKMILAEMEIHFQDRPAE